jgi:hypothetical protein
MKKKIMRKLIFALLALTLLSCKKDKPEPNPIPDPPVNPTKMILTFDANFEGDALVFGDTYINVSDYRVNFTDIRFYLSNIYGVKSSGDTVVFSEVAYFNLGAGKNTLVIDNPETGNYTSFGFGLGVAPELNSPANPNFNIAIYDSEHPLSVNNGMYWAWASGYRFVIFDGKYDTDASGTGPLISGYSIHTGKDESYSLKEITGTDINILSNTTNYLYLDMAVDQFFYLESDIIDLAIDNQSHGSNQVLSNRLTANILNATTLRD